MKRDMAAWNEDTWKRKTETKNWENAGGREQADTWLAECWQALVRVRE